MSHLTIVSNSTEVQEDIINPSKVSCYEQRNAHPRMSDRYSVVCTADMIEKFTQAGFEWSQGPKVKAREKNSGFEKHSINFVHPDIQLSDVDLNNEMRPRITMINSYNGTSRFMFVLGFIRFICENGLVLGDVFQKVQRRHIGITPSEIERMVAELIQFYNQDLSLLVRAMKDTRMNMDEQLALAERVMKERFKDDPYFQKGEYEKLVMSYRKEDDDDSVWNVVNRIQENIGLNYRKVLNPVSYTTLVESKDKALIEKVKTVKKISNLDKVTHLNKFIFNEVQGLYLPSSVMTDLKLAA